MSDSSRRYPLSEKEEAFCQEYLVDLNATQALIRSGHQCPNPMVIGRKLMNLQSIRSRIDELFEERSRGTGIDARWVLNAAVELHNRCMANVKPLDSNGLPIGVYRFDSSGANAALKTIGKHISVQAFKKLVEHTGIDGAPMVIWGNQSQSQPQKRRPPQPPRRKK